MKMPGWLQKTLDFFVTKIFLGIVVIVGLVILMEQAGRFFLDKTALSGSIKDIIIAFGDAGIALAGYIYLTRFIEHRKIPELSLPDFGKMAVTGFITGFALQAIFILVMYVTGNYAVLSTNSFSVLIQPFTFSFTAGFVAEIIIIGIVYRLLEKQIGTKNALIVFVILFAFLHINAKGATVLSVGTTALQAGLLIPATFVFTRSLWFPIFLHFAWDFAEPGIFGGINPSGNITHGLLNAKFGNSLLLTGGTGGPQNSIQAFILCLITGLLVLWLAKKRNNLVIMRRKESNQN
jgi:CAAX protease family protein